jgi:hypothetical protein
MGALARPDLAKVEHLQAAWLHEYFLSSGIWQQRPHDNGIADHILPLLLLLLLSLLFHVAPTFHLYRGGVKVGEMTGAKVERLKALIDEQLNQN